MKEQKKSVQVKCPTCGKSFSYFSSEFRPFCREKCREVDLGMWLTENYRVPSKGPLSDEDMDEVLKKIESKEDP